MTFKMGPGVIDELTSDELAKILDKHFHVKGTVIEAVWIIPGKNQRRARRFKVGLGGLCSLELKTPWIKWPAVKRRLLKRGKR